MYVYVYNVYVYIIYNICVYIYIMSVHIYMYQFISLRSCDYLYKPSIKINVSTDEGNSRNENLTLNKR